MSNFIPTTSVIRCVATNWDVKTKKKNFDRWLAEVKAQAWEEGYKQGSSDNYGSSSDVQYADNPYRQEGE